MILKKLFFYLLIAGYGISFAQLDTLRYQWPVTPFFSSHGLNATFCEFRNTLTSDHFHNAIDIGKADGEPCYPVIDGQVYTIDNSGSGGYVRIATHSNGQWKHFTYLHITPNPALSIGDNVTKGSTILGTIYPGQGHVHLIEREFVSDIDSYAAEINNVRPEGGVTPYEDPYDPVIVRNSLRFFSDGSNTEVPSYGLSGHIDIQVKITEHNGTSSSQINNGTYLAGYRIWNADTTQVIFEPADNGVKYRFDRKPYNSQVHQVFAENLATLSNPVYWLTNGSGADAINQNQTVVNGYFDASAFDPGDYVLQIFTEDTRSNSDIEFFEIAITDQDVTPPVMPHTYYLLNYDNMQSVRVGFKKNSEDDLLGYRLYYAADAQLTNWQLVADESLITKDSSTFSVSSLDSFAVLPLQDVYYFRLSAVDSSGNESAADDIYARSAHSHDIAWKKALIVNGFNRHTGTGSWQSPSHPFVKSYFEALNASDSLSISSCSNAAVEAGIISLYDYDMVIWFLGDESTDDDSFTALEQVEIKDYLENGGKLVVSGSEIGYDLGRADGANKEFYNNYLKAAYVYDGNSSMSPGWGIDGSSFSGVQLNFGLVYPENYPDDIDPLDGSQVIMHYTATRSPSVYRNAAIAYSGSFGNSSTIGQLVYLAFAFETVSSLQQRQNFMGRLLSYFSLVTDLEQKPGTVPDRIEVTQNYPNPFNNTTSFKINIPQRERVRVKIFDMLGQEVAQIVNHVLTPGEHVFNWHADNFASGLYMLQINSANYSASRKLILIK